MYDWIRKVLNFIVDYGLLDWIVAATAIASAIIVRLIPFADDFEESFTTDISQTLRTNTLPYFVVLIFTLAGVPLLLVAIRWVLAKNVSMNRTLSAYYTNIGLTMLFCAALKKVVARPRPDTISMCGGDGSYQRCHQILKGYDLANQFYSFPSSHAAESIAAFIFLTMYINDLWQSGSLIAEFIKLLPAALGIFIGTSRVWDRQCHVDDVAAGFLIGGLISSLVYKIFQGGQVRAMNSK